MEPGRQNIMPKSRPFPNNPVFPKPSARQVKLEDYDEDLDDQENLPEFGSWKPEGAQWPPYRPSQRQMDDQFDEARRYGEPDSTHDTTLDAKWPPYADVVNVPWRSYEDEMEKISPSQAPDLDQVVPGKIPS